MRTKPAIGGWIWLALLIICTCSSTVFATDLRTDSPFALGYFTGPESCAQAAAVRNPMRTKEWRHLDAAASNARSRTLWLSITATAVRATEQRWIVATDDLGVQELFFGMFSGGEITRLSRASPVRPLQFGSRSLALTLPPVLVVGERGLLCLSGHAPSVARVSVVPELEFRALDIANVAQLYSCLAIMFAMMSSALFFGTLLSDRIFIWYSGQVAAFVVFVSIKLWLWHRWFVDVPVIAEGSRVVADVALGVALVCGTQFISSFLSLPNLLPKAGRCLRGLGWLALAVSAAAALTSAPSTARIVIVELQNVIAVVIGLLALYSGCYLAWRGWRYARYFLAGWLPLLVISILATMDAALYDGAKNLTVWLLPAAAFEAIVLSLGMADRALVLRKERDAARRSAEVDPLTGVLNRRGLLQRLEFAEIAAKSNAEPGALLFCDLDYFKKINDQYGHDAGDACLQHFVACAEAVLRSKDAMGRFGGEEFVILLQSTALAQALLVAERLRRKVHQSAACWQQQRIKMTVSIGLTMIEVGVPSQALLAKADALVYRAKSEGRDRVCH